MGAFLVCEATTRAPLEGWPSAGLVMAWLKANGQAVCAAEVDGEWRPYPGHGARSLMVVLMERS